MSNNITLASINEEYERTLHSDLNDYEKAVKYGELMTTMEYVFNVPILKNEEWERNNKAVISLYRKLSMSRKF